MAQAVSQRRSKHQHLRLGALLFSLLAPGHAVGQDSTSFQKIDIETIPVTFAPLDSKRTRFGRLDWRGGFEVESKNADFGGLSGLVVDKKGARIIAVGDRGTWFSAEVTYKGAMVDGLSKAWLAPLTDRNGKPIARLDRRDAEAITIDGDSFSDGLLVGFERNPRVLRYGFDGRTPARKPSAVRIPKEMSRGPDNKELESVARLPASPPFDAGLMVISERHLDAQGNILGWIVGGPRAGRFSIRRIRDFSVTDIAVVPGTSDIITLERRFTPTTGVGMLLRLFKAENIRPGKTAEGQELFMANQLFSIDNMEGLAAHLAPNGEVRLTIVSDDNFSILQRTLLLQFALVQTPAQ